MKGGREDQQLEVPRPSRTPNATSYDGYRWNEPIVPPVRAATAPTTSLDNGPGDGPRDATSRY
jgi:hypothetical protein